MSKLNERISDLIAELGIKKTAFASRLNVSQAFVSQMCSGAAQPSDRTIADICREFNVNEDWLRTGEGAMFLERSRDDELSAFFGDVLSGQPDDFRRRLIAALSRLSVDEWAMVEHVATKLAEDMKKADQDES